MAMLEVKDLEVYYGVIQAIKGISFEVNKGEVIALIGANGAGKTTTLHTVTGLLSPKKGHVIFEGKRHYESAGPQDRIYGDGTRSGRPARVCRAECVRESEDGGLHTKR